MKETSSYYLLFFLFGFFNSYAQTKPTNHWQLGGSVGYAFSLHEKFDGYESLIVKNDSVVGAVPKSYRDGTGTGFNIDFEAIKQKKSGWFNIYGIQTFISLPNKFYWSVPLDRPVSQYSQTVFSGGYAMAKIGWGYRTNYKRNANLFLSCNLLYGGGWFKLKQESEFTGESSTVQHYSYAQTILLGIGANFEIGTLLKLNKKFDGVIKAGFNAAAFSVWKNSNEILKDSPFHETGDIVHDFFNINFSLGIRYNL